jgi:hypothetical protein
MPGLSLVSRKAAAGAGQMPLPVGLLCRLRVTPGANMAVIGDGASGNLDVVQERTP